eukprot:TRINITY_DN46728_c0_g1_i1.p1 TRINITY_DN46728_c0_g1~~TRINITY_DN46728_c0_g1_i1.p1  ORF type:complete len:271 (+),score=89.45 TRINITY_DN46728_c0_g1_i1:59-814(+)
MADDDVSSVADDSGPDCERCREMTSLITRYHTFLRRVSEQVDHVRARNARDTQARVQTAQATDAALEEALADFAPVALLRSHTAAAAEGGAEEARILVDKTTKVSNPLVAGHLRSLSAAVASRRDEITSLLRKVPSEWERNPHVLTTAVLASKLRQLERLNATLEARLRGPDELAPYTAQQLSDQDYQNHRQVAAALMRSSVAQLREARDSAWDDVALESIFSTPAGPERDRVAGAVEAVRKRRRTEGSEY